MLFSSFEFVLIFLPAAIIIYQVSCRLTNNAKPIQIVLFILSALFVMWGGASSLILLCISLVVNFAFLHLLSSESNIKRRKFFLILDLVFNLSFIGVFKYADFLASSVGFATGVAVGKFNLTLPLAISFYTFQLIALAVDSYREKWRPPPFSELALFVAFFPQLIAGPIVRYGEVRDDISKLTGIKLNNFNLGISIFFIGLFKKSVIADSLAPVANTFFAAVEAGAQPTLFESWGGILAYSFQIYFDFSGYSDMAIGLAQIFGIRIPVNFMSPYKAGSIIEFWRRWHMTLSRFLRDYLYVPLGGNRRGAMARWYNVFITMLLGGLWHGASWNFILWGGMHGIFIAINHAARLVRFPVPRWSGWTMTFASVSMAWVIFRTQNISAAARIYGGAFGLNGVDLPKQFQPIFGEILQPYAIFSFKSSELIKMPDIALVLCVAGVAFFLPNTEAVFRNLGAKTELKSWHAFAAGMAGIVGCFGIFQTVEFVYFRF